MKMPIQILLITLLFTATAIAGDYIIGEGDGLDIAVWGVKDLNSSVRVRPDGKITIPGLGDVVASGFTPKELQADLTTRLKDLVKNPIVSVSVREITNSKVYIFGAGVNSRVVDLNRRTTLLQLLCAIGSGPGYSGGAASGGGSKVPDYRKAHVLRSGKKIREDFYKLFILGDTSDDMVVESGDAIFIPEAGEKNVYVLGAVGTPKFLEYREGMTVMEAILECGGFTKFAKPNDTIILRKDGEKEQILEVRARDLVNDGDLKQNIKLRAGDYVIVKESIF